MSWSDVVRDNPWIAPVVGAVAVGVAFATAGPIWGLFNVYLLLFVALMAWDHSRRLGKSRRAAIEISATPGRPHHDPDALEPEPWNDRSREDMAHSLDLVPEMADSASADTIPAEEPQLRRLRPDAYPVLDAFVASTRSDPDGVRRALESWVRLAPSPDREKEREALLHYWLYRAGDAAELEELRALAAANPQLVEVALYLHLALQEYGELWS